MKSVGLILAKKDSNRLKDKNFMDFGDKPMFVWNLEKMLRIFDEVYVSSDYDLILEESKKMGAAPIKRPKKLCGDVPNIPVYRHAIEFMQKPEIVVAVQANSPTIKESLIKKAKDLMEKYDFKELMTCHLDFKLYGSIWAMSKNRLLNYNNPFKQTPEILLVDDSIDIHTQEDLTKALKQINLI